MSHESQEAYFETLPGEVRARLLTIQASVLKLIPGATKCISYLNIELRGEIPEELRGGLSDWLFGCDVCQDVCPWNRHAQETTEPGLRPVLRSNPRLLREMFSWTDEQFRAEFRRTPLWRARRRGILRNAAIVLGNQLDRESIPALELGKQDADEIIREASTWALKRILDQN